MNGGTDLTRDDPPPDRSSHKGSNGKLRQIDILRKSSTSQGYKKLPKKRGTRTDICFRMENFLSRIHPSHLSLSISNDI